MIAVSSRPTAVPQTHYILAALVLALGFAALQSCATHIPYGKPLDPARVLHPSATLYAKLDKPALTAAAVAIMSPENAEAVADAVARTDRITVAVREQNGAASESANASIEVIAEGRYPSGAANFALSSDPAWKREGVGFANTNSGLRVAFADDTVVVAGNAPLDGIAARLAQPGPDPLPVELVGRWATDVAVFLPNAGALFARMVDNDDAAPIPLKAVVLSGTRSAEGYSFTATFLFLEPRQAKVYAPPCKLALYALVGERWETVPTGVKWEFRNSMLEASGFFLSAEDFAATLTALMFPNQ